MSPATRAAAAAAVSSSTGVLPGSGSERPGRSGDRAASAPDPQGARTMTKAQDAKLRIDDAIASLTDELNAGKSETLEAFLAMLSKFHHYSFGNVMLILSQRPEATRVAGYRAWQQLGRQVRKGEKSITIIAPMMLKKESDSGDTEKVLRFRAASVFDIAQTDGDDLPEPASVQGDPGTALQALLAHADSVGITVDFGDLRGANGMSRGGHITLAEGMTEAETFSTLVHELAHELLHQGESAERGDKTTRELEAEAVAHTVCIAVGLEVGTACSDYIQSYGGDAKQLASVLERVQKTAHELVNAIHGAVTEC